MKLLILADTDIIGKSGVGDYAITLCNQLNKRSISATLRPIDVNIRHRNARLSGLIEEIKPDWVSLHFVPYAYSRRGFVTSKTLPWSKLRGSVGTHIFLHEIWVGAHKGASWKNRLIGTLQRRGIVNALRQLRPDIVHSSNLLYSRMLDDAAIPNHVLPLFGNIPVANSYADPYADLFNSFHSGSGRGDWVVAAFFGTIHPAKNLLNALKWLHQKSLTAGKYLLVVSLGHSPNAASLLTLLEDSLPRSQSPNFHIVGKLAAPLLSQWIRGADCGLATTPYNIIGKSGSAVSFVEHGIPVIVIDGGHEVPNIHYVQPDLSPEFWLYGDQRLDSFNCLPPRREPMSRIDTVVRQFMKDLDLDAD